jgi:YfiH family protein
VTKTPGLALSVLTADCAPILLADKNAGVVAAAHAGWKGALAGVLASTVQMMCANGARAQNIAAAIGPCIHQSSYEVGPELEARFVSADPSFARYFTAGRDDRRQFDLPGFCAGRLRALGIGRIEAADSDTYALPALYYSHRRALREKAADYGRNCAAIALG